MHRAVVGIIEAMRQSPLLLAVLILNVVIIGALLFMLREIAVATKSDRDTRNAILQQCMQRGGTT